jgi:hypothetical protein
MTRTPLLLILVPSLVFATACGGGGVRWVPYAPQQVHAPATRNKPARSYAFALVRAQQLGYRVLQADSQTRTIRLTAKLDAEFVGAPEWSTSRSSAITIQAEADGRLVLTVRGGHVRDRGKQIHRRMHEELTGLAAELRASLTGPGPPPGS